MPEKLPESIPDALRAAQARGVLPTSLDTAGLRALGAEILARSVFTARGSSAVFASKIKEVVDAIAAGNLSEGQARSALAETLDALGYDAETGGFPGEEVPEALRGTLQDLRSFRRLDLIVRTQRDLMQGAGEQWRGQQPDRLRVFPAYELVRIEERAAPRDWPARWMIAGGKLYGGRMIAVKGDPVWGELGSYENFSDALGVDHPPFAFQSGMGWREIPEEEVAALGVTGPNGETVVDWLAAGDGVTLAGDLPPVLPRPRISLADVDPEIRKAFQRVTQGTPMPDKPGVIDFSDLLTKEIAAHDASYGKGGNP